MSESNKNPFDDQNFGAKASEQNSANPFDDEEFGKPRSGVGEVVNQLKAGVVADLPQMAGQALQYSSDEGNWRYNLGKSIADFGKEQAQRPDLQAQPDQHGTIVNALAGGARAIPGSVVPAAAVGLGVSRLPMSAAAKLRLASILGAAPAGMSQAQDTLDKAKAAGVSDEDAKAAARRTGAIEWAGEAAGDYLTGKALGFAGKAIRGGAKTAEQTAQSLANPGILKPWLKSTGEAAIGETATEMAQNAGEAAVERAYGIDNQSPMDAAEQAIAPTLGMTALLAPFGLAGHSVAARSRRTAVQNMLSSQTAPDVRAQTMDEIYSELKGTHPEAAEAFKSNATAAILAGQDASIEGLLSQTPVDQSLQTTQNTSAASPFADQLSAINTQLDSAIPAMRQAGRENDVQSVLRDFAIARNPRAPEFIRQKALERVTNSIGWVNTPEQQQMSAAAASQDNATRLADLQQQEQGELSVPQTAAPDGAAIIANQQAAARAARDAEIAASRSVQSPDDEILQSIGRRPSELMGLDPANGPMSAAAAIAVDSGAHQQTLFGDEANGTARTVRAGNVGGTSRSRAAKNAAGQQNGIGMVPPVDAERSAPTTPGSNGPVSGSVVPGATGVAVTPPALKPVNKVFSARTDAQLQHLAANGKTPEIKAQAQAEIARRQNGEQQHGTQTAEAQPRSTPGTQAPAEATAQPAAGIANALQSENVGEKASQKTGTQTPASTPSKAKTPATRGKTAPAPVATPQPLSDAAKAWAGMTPDQRKEVASRANLNVVAAKNVHRAAWEKLHPDVQANLEGAMKQKHETVTPSESRVIEPGSDVDVRSNAWNSRIDAMTNDEARSLYDAIGLAGARGRVDEKAVLKQEHPDDLDAGMAALIARQNGIEVPGKTSPNDVLSALQDRRESQKGTDEGKRVEQKTESASEQGVGITKGSSAQQFSGAKDQEPTQGKQPRQQDKIGDFGSKIEGAAKDRMRAYIEKMQDASSLSLAEKPLSEAWPEPDYQALIDAGADRYMVAFAHAARDELPVKPRKGWKLKGWVAQAETLRNITTQMLSGKIDRQRITEVLADDKFSRVRDQVGGRAELYEAVGHETSLKGVTLEHVTNAYENQRISVELGNDYWAVRGETKKFSHWPTQYASGKTREAAIADFVSKYAEFSAKEKPDSEDKTKKFSLYRYKNAPKVWVVGKKIGSRYFDLKTFDSMAAAAEYRAEHAQELEEQLKKLRVLPSDRGSENAPRVGADHRNGADVGPEQFQETFGFRGGQFGNTMPAGERQEHLNRTYDALMDLAGVVGVPPKALSLNGELALAFGARGRGGVGAPSAHYERDINGKVSSGTVVINLTRRAGAGSLAHEWFHAVDNYFARMRSESAGMLTEKPWERGEGVRTEMVAAFKGVMNAVRSTEMESRSKAADTVKGKAYYATEAELAARAFESYVVDKLSEQGGKNDYLSNIVSEDYWNSLEAIRRQEFLNPEAESVKTYPYPTEAEKPVIDTSFDRFFDAVETKETPAGVAMFSRATPSPDDFVRAPNGDVDFGEITPEQGKAMRRQSGKIRLTRGVQNADGTGYGLAHIEARHGAHIRNAGYASVEQFVHDAVSHIDSIWSPGKTSQIIAVQTLENGKVLFLELQPARDESGDYYRVNSAFPVGGMQKFISKKMESEGWKPLWNRYPVPSDASGAPGFVGKSPSAGETAPMVSPQSGKQNIAQGGEKSPKNGTMRDMPAFDNASGNFNPDLPEFWLKQARKEIDGSRMSDADYYTAVAEYANERRIGDALEAAGWKRRGSSNVSSSAYYEKDVGIGEKDPEYGEYEDYKKYEIRLSDHPDYHPADGTVEHRYQVTFRNDPVGWEDAHLSPDASNEDVRNAIAEIDSEAEKDAGVEFKRVTNENSDIDEKNRWEKYLQGRRMEERGGRVFMLGGNSEFNLSKIRNQYKLELPSILAKENRSKTKFVRALSKTKILDVDGNPKILYHGTNQDFDVFEVSSAGKKGELRLGVWLTDDFDYAEWIASGVHTKTQNENAKIKPVYLNSRNPFVFDIFEEALRISERDGLPLPETPIEAQRFFASGNGWDEFVASLAQSAKDDGYDSLVLKNFDDNFSVLNNRQTTAYIAFYPEQIIPADKIDPSAANQGQPKASQESAYAIARKMVLGDKTPQSTVEQVRAELAKRVPNLGPNIHVIQSALDLPAKERASVFNSWGGATDLQGVYFPDPGHAYLVADNIPPGHAYSMLLHEAGVHGGLRGMVGDSGMRSLAGQLKIWSRQKGEHADLARKALARIPETTRQQDRDEELIAYFVTEAAQAGHGLSSQSMIGRWFDRLWSMVKTALVKLGMAPETLTVDDVVSLAQGALERVANAKSRDVLQFREASTNKIGPVFQSIDGLTLDPKFEINHGDGDFAQGGFAEHGLMGHYSHALPESKTYGFNIVDPNGKVVGYLAGDVQGGRIVSVHDIEIQSKMKGTGSKVIAGLTANGPVKAVDILDQSERFWARHGAERDWQGNGYANWEASRRSLGRQPSGSEGQGVQSGRVTGSQSVDRSAESLSESDRRWLEENGLKDGEGGYFASRAPSAVIGSDVARQVLDATRTTLSSPVRKFLKNTHTQLHKALTIPEFGKVYGLVEQWAQQSTRSIHNAASQAPDILHSYDNFSSAWNSLKRSSKDAAAMPRVWKMLEAGTLAGDTVLEGKRYSSAELRQMFNATDKELALVDQARKAIDASLDESAASVAWRLASKDMPPDVMQQIAASPARAEFILRDAYEDAIAEAKDAGSDPSELKERAETVQSIFDRSQALKDAGYVPLMRFGKYSVTVKNADGTTAFFGKYDTALQMQRSAAAVRPELKEGQSVETGEVNETASRLWKGIDPESVALFIDRLGKNEDLDLPADLMDQARQEWLKVSAGERSAMARAIHRKGTPGFSTDLTRVLSNFVTSTGRMAARNYYNADIMQSIQAIPHAMGDVQQDAQALKEYIDNPSDPFAPVRGLMFGWYMGGSIASALVNLTQPVMMTFPFLSQYGVGKAASALAYGTQYAMTRMTAKLPADMREAMQRASDEGIVDPNEVHNVFSAGMDSVFKHLPGGEKAQAAGKALSMAWGALFGFSETFNRRATFIAAYKMATETPGILKEGQSAYEFAADAVKQTQGVNQKFNRPNWARGTGAFGVVGAAAFTFKTYSINYVELLKRLMTARNPDGTRNLAAMKAGTIMLGTLVLASGIQGAPGADDLDDLIDTLLQALGFNGNAKRWKREQLASVLGNDMAEAVMYGASSMTPIDVQARMGMGNMLPTTGILKNTNRDNKASQIAELFGAPGNLANAPADAWEAWQAGRRADVLGAFMPLAIRNGAKALEMLESGEYKDTKGRNVASVSGMDALAKVIGFQPNSVAKGSRIVNEVRQDITRVQNLKSDANSLYAQGVFEQDEDKKNRARQMIEDWNSSNPDARISLNVASIAQRVKQMRTERDVRIAKQAPRSMRKEITERLGQS